MELISFNSKKKIPLTRYRRGFGEKENPIFAEEISGGSDFRRKCIFKNITGKDHQLSLANPERVD